jgi:hypothetical protein
MHPVQEGSDDLDVPKMIINFVFGPAPLGGPWGGSGLPFALGDRVALADSGPDPGGNPFFILILA